jgi:hypothetical protein
LAGSLNLKSYSQSEIALGDLTVHWTRSSLLISVIDRHAADELPSAEGAAAEAARLPETACGRSISSCHVAASGH